MRHAVVQHMDALMSEDTLNFDNQGENSSVSPEDDFNKWFGEKDWETEVSKEEAREELYLFWTGRYPDGTRGDIHDIDIVQYENYMSYAEKINSGINIGRYEDYDALAETYGLPKNGY